MMATAVGTTRAGELMGRAPGMGSWLPKGSGERPTKLRTWAAGEMRRHDLVKIMEAGQAIGSYNARRWIGEVDVPTTVLITTRDRAVSPAEQHKLVDVIPGAEAQLLDDGHIACAKREFGPGPRAGGRLGGGPPALAARRLTAGRRHRWDRSPACASSRSRGSAPGPFCAMVLADLGADVIAVDRPAGAAADARERPRTTSCAGAAAPSPST